MAGIIQEDAAVFKQLTVGSKQTVAGRTGRMALFTTKVSAAMGGWFNASKSYVDLTTTGSATGLLSAHCMEVLLPSTVQAGGHITIAEHELVCAASTTVNSNISFQWFQVSGDATAKTDWNLKGSLFECTGFAVGNGNVFANGTPTVFTHTLRIRVDDVNYYIPLADAYNAS